MRFQFWLSHSSSEQIWILKAWSVSMVFSHSTGFHIMSRGRWGSDKQFSQPWIWSMSSKHHPMVSVPQAIHLIQLNIFIKASMQSNWLQAVYLCRFQLGVTMEQPATCETKCKLCWASSPTPSRQLTAHSSQQAGYNQTDVINFRAKRERAFKYAGNFVVAGEREHLYTCT